jgi:hypothetical protein
MRKIYRAHRLSQAPEPSGTFINPYLLAARRPLHSSIELHNLADSWFEDRFGMRFRSKALFGTGDICATYEYCDDLHGPISIEPVGDYQLCYSPSCKDMYRHFQSIKGALCRFEWKWTASAVNGRSQRRGWLHGILRQVC